MGGVGSPVTDESVSGEQDDDRIDADILEAGGEQQSEINAGPRVGGDDVAGSAQALGLLGVGWRRIDVLKAIFVYERSPDRLNLAADRSFGRLLVAVKPGARIVDNADQVSARRVDDLQYDRI